MRSFLLHAGLLSLLLAAPAAQAVDPAHAHDHHAPAKGLHLDHGRRWATDPALRQGMSAIRDAVVAAVHADRARPLSAAEATRLADAIQGQVDFLVANCRLAPEADAVLHVLIGQMLEGAGALRRHPADDAALQRIVHALKEYPDYFEHEGWRPVTSAAPAP